MYSSLNSITNHLPKAFWLVGDSTALTVGRSTVLTAATLGLIFLSEESSKVNLFLNLQKKAADYAEYGYGLAANRFTSVEEHNIVRKVYAGTLLALSSLTAAAFLRASGMDLQSREVAIISALGPLGLATWNIYDFFSCGM